MLVSCLENRMSPTQNARNLVNRARADRRIPGVSAEIILGELHPAMCIHGLTYENVGTNGREISLILAASTNGMSVTDQELEEARDESTEAA